MTSFRYWMSFRDSNFNSAVFFISIRWSSSPSDFVQGKVFFTQTAACLSVFQNVFLDLAISSEPAEERCTNRGCVKTTHPLEYLCVQYQNWPLTTEQSIIYHMFFYRVAGANPNCHWTRERYSSPVHRRATQQEQPFTPHRQRLSNSIVWLNEYV